MSNNHATFIWSIADLLRGSFKAHQYGDIILPFTVLRRLDAVLAPTKQAVFAAVEQAKADDIPVRASLLKNKAGHTYSFWNESMFDLKTALGDSENLAANLSNYVTGFSENVKDIFDKYKIADRIAELDEHNLLFLVTQRFAEVDLSPTAVPNEEMGHIFEELIRKFAEASNETAGEHFTPRDVIELMVDILLAPESETLAKANVVRSVYDPTAGTGGMLSVAEDHIRSANPSATLTLAGQEINPQSYAICKADMTVKGQSVDAIFFGDTLLNDGHAGATFSYGLSNPPFGVDWKKQQKAVTEEYSQRGFAGRFGAGLPRVSDGSMLFLLHLISKMRSAQDGGGRAAIVLNGSPLFTGGAGSGESNIRKWVLERDLLEAIIALPTDMFYNTGIATYVWVLSTKKSAERVGRVQLIDGSKMFRKMRKGLGSKRNELASDDIAAIVELYEDGADHARSKTFDAEDFFYRTITVERPVRLNWALTPARFAAARQAKTLSKVEWGAFVDLAAPGIAQSTDLRDFRTKLNALLNQGAVSLTAPQLRALLAGLSQRDKNAPIVLDSKKRPEPDPTLRDTENVPWAEDIHAYFEREVKPFAPDAWIDESKTREGCEIPFTRHFYEYVPPRSLAEIDADLEAVLGRIRARLEAVKA
ncbi:type I restriction-modification system subunit M [Microbacterium sp. 1.5R]|uniref:type I restriction-modification system subunit M n=1 Tax=Microbacterium sp. 1.5R TaxID=1916917 RepID=UPI0009F90585|nr:class I SAM-dependent DNA methyltransferase [Microbacterium sp. 1.5R]